MTTDSRPALPWWPAAAAMLAVLGLIWAASALLATERGLRVQRLDVGAIPATVRVLDDDRSRRPAVVIAHGFAGSRQLMQPLATTLARAGFVAISFDFPGHGQHPQPLRAGLADQAAMSDALRDALAAVVRAARAHPLGDGRVALLGHSMASDVVVRLGIEDPAIAATIAVSLFFPRATDTAPRNLLIIDGALEGAALHAQGLDAIRAAAGGAPEAGPIYGRFDDGSARRLVLASGAEHIGVLYAQDTLDAAVDWLAQSFAIPAAGDWRDRRGLPLAVLFASLLLIVWPLSRGLPALARPPAGLGLSRGEVLRVAGPPALLTPVLLWPLPHDGLPLLLGGYLAMHFALYGVLIAVFAFRRGHALPGRKDFGPRTLLAALVVALLLGLLFGLPLDRWVASVAPQGQRWAMAALMALALLPYFVIDEWLCRGPAPATGVYPLSKLLLLASLSLAVAMNLYELFFLIIIVPVILLLFAVFGLTSRWLFAHGGQPLVAAIANAALFGWLIAVSFPMVAS